MNAEKSWVRITHCENIPLRQGRAVQVGEREIAIFNLGECFMAIDNCCPHKGGPLADGIVSGTTVVCPLHAWKLDLETGKGANSVSAASSVETFRTRVEHGVIFVELPMDSAAKKDTHHACIQHTMLAAGNKANVVPAVNES